MLNPTFKIEWITALESGKYKQATGRLNNGKGGWCCLGVAADIKGAKWEPVGFGTSVLKAVINGKDASISNGESYLAPDFLAEIGLTHNEQRKLGEMNDDGIDFPTIATYIKNNL